MYLLALSAQFAFDAGAVFIRHRFGRGVQISDLVPALTWIALVDAALAPCALLLAFATRAEPASIIAVLPLAGLLHVLGAERRRRIDESIALGQAVQVATREARSDPLTGVGNRLAWQEAVERAERRLVLASESVSVLLVDLNELKKTNDTYGHDTGDRYIQALAVALRAGIRDSDELARIGGDEFAILAVGAGEQGCKEIVTRIREQLAGVPLSASLGAASYPPCASLDEALRLADERLYTEKLRSELGESDRSAPRPPAHDHGAHRTSQDPARSLNGST